jgi:hypothetical protein
LFLASSKRVKNLFEQQILKEPKLAQFEKVVYKRFTTVCLEVERVTEPMTTLLTLFNTQNVMEMRLATLY